MRQIKLSECLRLDSFGIDMPLLETKAKVVDLLNNNNINADILTHDQVTLITLKSKMLALDMKFCITFQFVAETPVAITIVPGEACKNDNVYHRYKTIEKSLERRLGKPHNPLMAVTNLLDRDSCQWHWSIKGVKIKHYLLNRFGIEEIIDIKLPVKFS